MTMQSSESEGMAADTVPDRYIVRIDPLPFDAAFLGRTAAWYRDEQSLLSLERYEFASCPFVQPALPNEPTLSHFIAAHCPLTQKRTRARSAVYRDCTIVEIAYMCGIGGDKDNVADVFNDAGSQIANALGVAVTGTCNPSAACNAVVVDDALVTYMVEKRFGVYKRTGFDDLLRAMRITTEQPDMSVMDLATLNTNTRAVEKKMHRERDFVRQALCEANPDYGGEGECDASVDSDGDSDGDNSDGSAGEIDSLKFILARVSVAERYNHLFVECRRTYDDNDDGDDDDDDAADLIEAYTKYVEQIKPGYYMGIRIETENVQSCDKRLREILADMFSKLDTTTAS